MILIPRVILPQSDSTGSGHPIYRKPITARTNSTRPTSRPIYRKPIIRGQQLYKTNIVH
ncbi:hypothetical protein DPMN_002225 [Dreissena polymorpha]|uniref:Uncharacterized protein n=1 Tax=Dreissena polymorpha TaxID=45954 RepID=A0A9D4MN88_DREPO|nr:hypothetical protein DPMN_002225 [Dreissena polymorpha]